MLLTNVDKTKQDSVVLKKLFFKAYYTFYYKKLNYYRDIRRSIVLISSSNITVALGRRFLIWYVS